MEALVDKNKNKCVLNQLKKGSISLRGSSDQEGGTYSGNIKWVQFCNRCSRQIVGTPALEAGKMQFKAMGTSSACLEDSEITLNIDQVIEGDHPTVNLYSNGTRNRFFGMLRPKS